MLLFCAGVGLLLTLSFLACYGLVSREAWAQLDRELTGAAGPVFRDLVYEPGNHDINDLDLKGEYFELLNANGDVLQHSANFVHPIDQVTVRNEVRGPIFRTVKTPYLGAVRTYIIPFDRGGRKFFFLIGVSTAAAENSLANFRRATLFLIPCSILLTGLVSAWYVGRILNPISVLTDHAAQMTMRVSDPLQKQEWRPLPVANPHDELGRLSITFNELLARVDSALTQLRQFVTDASHELRTPLSVMQVETELMLSDQRLHEEGKKSAAVVHDEVKKLGRIVEGLFTLAIADAGQLKLDSEPLYINEVLEDACVVADQVAKPKKIVISRNLREEIAYFGDEAFLRDLFLIFLENAVKYSPAATQISVDMRKKLDRIVVAFSDQGIGIESQHVPHIFERFYRVVQNNGTEARSGGLGLSIAQVIVNAQSGNVRCDSTPGLGSTFTIELPSSAHTA